MALKYAFKLFFLKWIYEIMINTAPSTSNSFYGREKHCGSVAQWSRIWLHLDGGWKGVPIQIQVNIPFPILVNKVTQSGTYLERKEFYDASLLKVWPEEGLTDHGKDK